MKILLVWQCGLINIFVSFLSVEFLFRKLSRVSIYYFLIKCILFYLASQGESRVCELARSSLYCTIKSKIKLWNNHRTFIPQDYWMYNQLGIICSRSSPCQKVTQKEDLWNGRGSKRDGVSARTRFNLISIAGILQSQYTSPLHLPPFLAVPKGH